MSETKHLSTGGFVPVEDINLEAIKFKDKSREKQRKNNLAAKQAAKEQRKQEKSKEAAANASRTAAMNKKTAKQRRAVQTAEDADELDREYRLLRSLKKGRIDENEFAKLTGTEDGS